MPRCADQSCGRWRPERLAPRWAGGIRFNGSWYCSRACVESAAREGLEPPRVAPAPIGTLPPLRLGVLLRHMGAISEAELNEALRSQQTSGRRLGQELQRLRIVSAEPIVRALAAQSAVSYLTAFDVDRVTRGPSWLPAATVRALGLVPFDVDGVLRRVKVVCSAPVSRSATTAMAKLTGWTAEPYLVDDEVWRQALDAYRPVDVVDTETAGHSRTVGDVAAAAACVAEAAQTARAITMRSANCDRYTWVRVEGPRLVSDVLVPASQGRERRRRNAEGAMPSVQ
jgi:hypothetical protein